MAEIGTPKEDDSTAALERAANSAINFAVAYGKKARKQFRREFGSKETPVTEQFNDFLAMHDDPDAWERRFRERGLQNGITCAKKMQERMRSPS